MRTWINELIHVGGRSLLFARLDRTDDKCGARVSSNGKSGLPNKTSRGINKITDRFAPRYDSREQKYLQVHRTNRSRAIRGTMGNWFGCVPSLFETVRRHQLHASLLSPHAPPHAYDEHSTDYRLTCAFDRVSIYDKEARRFIARGLIVNRCREGFQ